MDAGVWFHYDVDDDVLYLRLVKERETPSLGEETEDGLTVLRAEEDDRMVGLTVVNWWRRFGTGELPDSLARFSSAVESWSRPRLAA